jgi:hypothetical protein
VTTIGLPKLTIYRPNPAGPRRIAILAAAELRAHGHSAAALQLAQRATSRLERRSRGWSAWRAVRNNLVRALCLAEQWARRADPAGAHSREFPQNVEFCGRLAAVAARRGDRADAERRDVELQRLFRPYLFGRETAWRARAAALLGDHERAVRLFVRAFAEGQPYGAELHTDQDLEPLRQHEAFCRLLRPKG